MEKEGREGMGVVKAFRNISPCNVGDMTATLGEEFIVAATQVNGNQYRKNYMCLTLSFDGFFCFGFRVFCICCLLAPC